MKQLMTTDFVKNLFHRHLGNILLAITLWIANNTFNLIVVYHRAATMQRLEQTAAIHRNELINVRQDTKLEAIQSNLNDIKNRLDQQPRNKE